MNAERLIALYDRVADAADAIPRLRRLILDLAIRGKLVSQDSGGESASALLERIAAEKARLFKAGEIRKPKSIPARLNPPFSIPPSWHWSCIAEISVLSPRNEAPENMAASFVPMPLISTEYGVPNQHEIRPWGEIKNGYSHFADGDVGLAKITPCFENGKSTVFRNLTGGLGSGTTELHVARPLLADPEYVLIFLKSPHFVENGIARMTGTAGQKRVPTEYFAYSAFPVPPLAEQHRIVAKVKELMELCDQLEAARARREEVRAQLTVVGLGRLTIPETIQARALFALEALPTFTTRADQIKQLRQTIRNLAIRGKLGTQSDVDEAAFDLLTCISLEKEQLIRAGKFKTLDVPLPREPDNFPFNLPNNWTWCYLDDIAAVARGGSPRPIKSYITDDPEGLPWIKIGDSERGKVYIDTTEERIISEGLPKTRLVIPGDLLLSNSMSFGYPYITNIQGCIHDGWLVIRTPKGLVDKLYIHLLLLSSHAKATFSGAAAGAVVQNLNADKVRTLKVPLPPLAEQHRIVAKVDELMALCDQLEVSLAAADATRSRLLEALLHEALNGDAMAEAA